MGGKAANAPCLACGFGLPEGKETQAMLCPMREDMTGHMPDCSPYCGWAVVTLDNDPDTGERFATAYCSVALLGMRKYEELNKEGGMPHAFFNCQDAGGWPNEEACE